MVTYRELTEIYCRGCREPPFTIMDRDLSFVGVGLVPSIIKNIYRIAALKEAAEANNDEGDKFAKKCAECPYKSSAGK